MDNCDGSQTKLEIGNEGKDSRIIADINFTFDKDIHTQVNKDNHIVGIIRRTFEYNGRKTFLLLFKIPVRPILEYSSSASGTTKKEGITMIENVQQRATRMESGMEN